MSTPEAKPLPLRVRLPYSTEAEMVERYAGNVARGGVFIATRTPKAEGTAIAFEFVLADGTRVLEGEGVVIKVQSGVRAGMTVRYTRLDAASKALVDRLVAHRQAAAAAPKAAEPPAPEAFPDATSDAVLEPEPPPAKISDLHRRITVDMEATRPSGAAQVRIDDETANDQTGDMPVPSPLITAFEEEPRTEFFARADLLEAIEEKRPAELVVVVVPTPPPTAAPSESTLGLYLDGLFAHGASVAPRTGLSPVMLGETRSGLATAIKLNEQGRLEFTSAAAASSSPSQLLRDALPLLGKRREHPELKDRFDWGVTPLLLAGSGEPDLLWQGQTFNAMALAVTALRAVKLEAESSASQAFLHAVLAVPLALGDAERRAWKQAASMAGFSSVGLINVTSAIMLAFAHPRGLARKRILNIHMDPFVLEAAVAELTGSDVEIVLSQGDLLVDRDGVAAVEHFMLRLRQALELQGLPLQKMDTVIFTGQRFETRELRETVEHLLGTRGGEFPEASDAPALGAAVWADSLSGRAQGRKGISLSDVLGTSVDVVLTPGSTERILERGMRLPAEKVLTPGLREAQELEVAVFEGPEHRFVGLAKTRTERSGEMTLRFTATSDGVLEIVAQLPGGKEAPLKLSAQQSPRANPRQALAAAATPPAPRGFLGGISRMFKWSRK